MLTQQINVRIEAKLYERLRKATNRDENWEAPTMSAVIQRGIVLALKEIGDRDADADTTDATKRKQRVR